MAKCTASLCDPSQLSTHCLQRTIALQTFLSISLLLTSHQRGAYSNYLSATRYISAHSSQMVHATEKAFGALYVRIHPTEWISHGIVVNDMQCRSTSLSGPTNLFFELT